MDREKFESLVDRGGGEEACHFWLGPVFVHGAGRAGNANAHRVAWEAKNGPVPDGKVVRRKCGTNLCVNDAHMELVKEVTQLDEHRRGRAGWRGSRKRKAQALDAANRRKVFEIRYGDPTFEAAPPQPVVGPARRAATQDEIKAARRPPHLRRACDEDE